MDQIGICLYSDCSSRGGVFVYTVRMLELFKTLGLRTYLITREATNTTESGILVDLLAFADEFLLLNSDETERSESKKICNYLYNNNIVFFIPNYRRTPYQAAARLSRRKAITVIGVCHNDHPSYYQILKRYASVIDSYICFSSVTFDKLKRQIEELNDKYKSNRIFYVPHYVKTSIDRRAQWRNDPFTVIYHGRIQEEQKHCSEIVEIAKLVCSVNRNINFKLVGDGVDKKAIARRVQDLNLESRVDLKESMGWADLQWEIASAQVAILTSAFEGFCYGAAEAMSFGLPVVAYDCGSVLDDYLVNKVNGVTVGWGDRRLISKSILDLAKSEKNWLHYSNHALTTAENTFSFQRALHGYQDVLKYKNNKRRSWPLVRPIHIPEAGKSIRSFWERLGLGLGLWS